MTTDFDAVLLRQLSCSEGSPDDAFLQHKNKSSLTQQFH